jgi:hypothetical protein
MFSDSVHRLFGKFHFRSSAQRSAPPNLIHGLNLRAVGDFQTLGGGPDFGKAQRPAKPRGLLRRNLIWNQKIAPAITWQNAIRVTSFVTNNISIHPVLKS